MSPGGKSCCLPGCYTHAAGKKYNGISLFTIPTRKCDAEWTKKLCDVISLSDGAQIISEGLKFLNFRYYRTLIIWGGVLITFGGRQNYE